MSAMLPRDWDSLRRMAKQMEAECENKLSAFARAASASASGSGTGGFGRSGAPDVASTSIHVTEAQLEDLLKKLGQVVEQMSSVLTPASPSSSYLLVQRQRDTLQEHTREFRRIRANLIAAKEHSELLNSVRSDIHAHKAAAASGTDYFLSERSHLDNTHIMIDEIIDQAHETRANLDSQRQTLLGAHRRVVNLGTVFPQLNSLMTRIRLRRRRDTLILSFVTAVCIFTMYLYYS
ncbi:protein transport protein gos1 [Blastocladiella emersonii ATCC 22665]|nr:protein transport protein gos1 [Blastocladiella emersonii ATCC 22665]